MAATREQKKHLRTLVGRGMVRGLVSSMRYENLKAARDYATATGQEFQSEAHAALKKAAREWLHDALNYEQGRGKFI